MEDKKNRPKVDEEKSELDQLKEEVNRNLAGWQRAQADYANFKKEMEKRQGEMMKFANAAFMSEVLPVYSHFKLALDHIPQDERKKDWVVGILQIKKQFQDFLKKYKIEEIKTVGEKFDHQYHEAVAFEEAKGYNEGQIFEEVQPGYLVEGQILNPAKVKVAK